MLGFFSIVTKSTPFFTDFAKEVREYIHMVDMACKMADDETLKAMERHFLMCCKLEHMFWDQAAELMQWPDFVGHPSTKN